MTGQFQFFQSLPHKKAEFVKKKPIELWVVFLIKTPAMWGVYSEVLMAYPSQRKTWRSRVFSLLKELDIFLSSQGKGDFSHFTFFPCTQRNKRKITTRRFWRICDGVWKGFSMFDPDFETVWGKSWSIPEQLQLSRLTQGEVRWAKGEKYTEHLWQIHVTTLTNPFSDLDNRWSDHQVDKDDWDDQDNHRGVDDLDNCQDHRDCEA